VNKAYIFEKIIKQDITGKLYSVFSLANAVFITSYSK
jgi:hypothetical protein